MAPAVTGNRPPRWLAEIATKEKQRSENMKLEWGLIRKTTKTNKLTMHRHLTRRKTSGRRKEGGTKKAKGRGSNRFDDDDGERKERDREWGTRRPPPICLWASPETQGREHKREELEGGERSGERGRKKTKEATKLPSPSSLSTAAASLAAGEKWKRGRRTKKKTGKRREAAGLYI